MGLPSRTNPSHRLVAALVFFLIAPLLAAQTQPVQATSIPLMLPSGLAYDAAGNLAFAETTNHIVRQVSPAGMITTLAGTGTQGFAGDGGPATSALLDSPLAVAFDSAANLYIADAHNHRIRRVDAASGIITSLSAQFDLPVAIAFDGRGNLCVADARKHLIERIDHISGVVSVIAGNGTQGFSGDLGTATQAAVDSPYGIAFDSAGNLYFSDSHNHRLRRVDDATGIISSIAGTGQPGFSGDSAPASHAAINLPRGLAVDAAGDLFLVDSQNQRIRRIDAVSGQIATIAGEGTQAFRGDNNPAVAASLNSPRAVALAPGNLPTIADTGNQRVRQIDSAANIHTIAGLGTTVAGTLTLSGPAVTLYGTGAVTARLVASPATGSITFFDASQSLGTAILSANVAVLPTSTLSAGAHRLFATYLGDTVHPPAQSAVLTVNISPAPAVATPNAIAILYGQPVPPLTGALTGVLPQDSGLVTLGLTTSATATALPGSYFITAAISGPQAGNYALTQSTAAVAISRAPSAITMANALVAHVSSTTSGQPVGAVSLYDAGTLNSTVALSPSGDATFSSGTLSTGTHTLTAVYGGDVDFLPATSVPLIAIIGSVVPADFSLAPTGPTSVTVQAGSAAQFSFDVNPINGALSSPILLTVSGLPSGATATFNPSFVTPANTPSAFILTIQTPKTAGLMRTSLLTFAILLPVGVLASGRRRRRVLLATGLGLIVGCGDRINTRSATAASATYNVTVIATATSIAGTTLQHTAGVTLTIQ